MSSQVYLNGTFAPKLDAKISVYDHGLLYGDGVWEGMRLRSGEIPRLDEHLKYLFAAAEAVSLPLHFSLTELAETVRSAIARNSRRYGYVRVIVTRGPGTIGLDPRKCDPQVIVLVDDVVPFPSELYEHGLHVISAKRISLDPGNPLHRVRSLSHGHMVLAKSEALRAGCLDGVLLTRDGRVAGTTEGHLFAVKNGSILSPPIEESVPEDVAADVVRERFAVRRSSLTLADLLEADELFLAGSTGGVIGIVRLDDRTIGSGAEGSVTRSIRMSASETVS